MGYPPAPWRLHGEVIIVPALRGGIVLADYTGGTLAYHELIVFSGLVVSRIYVDSPESMRGGREIWRLPKELAEFSYTRSAVEVRKDGRVLLRARVRRRRGRVPLVIPGPAIGDGKVSVGWLRMRAAPALVTLDAPELGLNGTRPALAGDGMRLFMP
ncbi:acetoacetate decarboxylase family protein [Candidatus Solirubrobacter pratensis]|uniref:acetoacetate decarboxylase family protein n=1 Tax=Candidatus Solirubrobacter pratensis TaxID=1298857 RepID=UPI000408A475|nr:acetoacetate decarboxylase family protein [Candidatus Solirubrobacter pratensis]